MFQALLIIMVLLLSGSRGQKGRGRGRGKTKSRVQIGMPITGKYRDPESDQYYNNKNVSTILFTLKLGLILFQNSSAQTQTIKIIGY